MRVQYEHLEDAERAIDGTKEATFNGRKLTVEYCAPQAPAAAPRDAGPPPSRERRPLDYPFRAPPERGGGGLYDDVYGPRMREAYPAPCYGREPPPPRRFYEREAVPYPAGRLEREYGPPPPHACSYFRREPRDFYYDPRYEEAAYFERRVPPPRYEAAGQRPLRAHNETWQAERPLRRMADADERFDPASGGKTARVRCASPGPGRKLARYDSRYSENRRDGPQRSLSPRRHSSSRAVSPVGRYTASDALGARRD